MKRFIFLIFVLFLSGCNLTQNYALQYTFSGEPATETILTATSDGVHVEVPFADMSCDLENLQAVLERDQSDFNLNIMGPETPERCSVKFSATIKGIESGTYMLNVIYNKPSGQQQVIAKKFTVN